MTPSGQHLLLNLGSEPEAAARGTCRSSGLLQGTDREFGGCPETQGAFPASEASLTCGTPAHLETLGLRTFEVQHETLAQARVGGSGRCLELQRKVGPRGEEAAARLRPSLCVSVSFSMCGYRLGEE